MIYIYINIILTKNQFFCKLIPKANIFYNYLINKYKKVDLNTT